MATQAPTSPSSSSSLPKRAFPSFSVRRASASAAQASASRSSLTNIPGLPTAPAVAASPTAAKSTLSLNTFPSTTTNPTVGSGIPASLRSLRNLLPFGGSNHNNNSSNINNASKSTATAAAPGNATPNTKSAFTVGLGTMRRSMHILRDKEADKDSRRKMSLSTEALAMPVLSIERRPSEPAVVKREGEATPPLRRSISLSGLEDAARVGKAENSSQVTDEKLIRAPILRTPSPGPCLLTELSTIIEADSSGISKHVPFITSSTEPSFSLSGPDKFRAWQTFTPEDEDYTIRRPVLPTTSLMPSSALTPSTPVHQQVHFTPTSVQTTPSSSYGADVEMELSTSHLALQVKDAMARASSSWTRSSDRAFVIDADTSFMPIHDSPPSEEGEADANASLLAVVDADLDSPVFTPGDKDDTSRVNNSVASVINPNEVLQDVNTTMDLGSLDPDLRAAVSQTLLKGGPSPKSPNSIDHSSASGRTITMSLPPIPPRRDSLLSPLRLSSSRPGSSSSAATLSTSKTTKRRVASSFLPRLRSPPGSASISESTPVSAKTSPSPQKINFDSPPGTTSPRATVFFQSHAVPPIPPTLTPAKGKQKKGFQALGTGAVPVNGGDSRKSSVPVGSWRNSREIPGILQKERDDVQPEVRVLEASSEIDPGALPETTLKKWEGEKEKLRVETTWIKREARPGSESDIQTLGSPFFPLREQEKLNGFLAYSSSYSTPSSPAPPPLQPSHHLRSTTPNKSTQHSQDQDASTTPTRFAPSPSPSPYLPPQSLVFNPTNHSSSIHTNDTSPAVSRSGSLRATGITARERDSDAEGSSPTRLFDEGSLSGRPSRRVPAPLRLFWGSGGSESTASSSGMPDDRIRIVPPERQPSPLKSVLRTVRGRKGEDDDDENGRIGDDEGEDYFGGGPSRGARPSMDGSDYTTIPVRPSLDSSARPSLDSYGASSMSGNTGGVDPGYYKYVVETPGVISRPGTRMTMHRDRDREPDRERDREGQGLVARVRKRSMSVQENFENTPGGNLTTAVLNARERLARVRYGDLAGATRPWSSMSMRSSGRRTTSTTDKPGRKSAIYDRERSPVITVERSVSERAAELERERSASVSQAGGGLGSLGRYASLRTASEFNFGSSVNLSTPQLLGGGGGGGNMRSFSRMTFTEGHGRKESTQGLMESPTYTVSTSSASGSGSRIGDRETQRSASTSTGVTSISQSSSSNPTPHASNNNKDRDREELTKLKEKHSVETGALLSALSDSQRTCRVLREENTELREKMGEVERENESLKRLVNELEREVGFAQREREREKERESGRERLWDPRGDMGGRGLSASVWGPNSTAGGAPSTGGWRAVSTPVTKQRDRGSALKSSVKPSMSKWSVFERDLEPLPKGQHGSTLADVSLGRHTSRSKLDNVLFSRDIPGGLEADDDRISESRMNRQEDEELTTPVEKRTFYQDAERANSAFLAPTNNVNDTGASGAHLRRPSTSSSIFPVPPSNMTMLLHDDMGGFSGTPTSESNRSSPSLLAEVRLPSVSPYPPSLTSRVINSHQTQSHSIGFVSNSLSISAPSNVSVSPTTENFSMITAGSPGSLFLKPEHEMMLDEMESLDLGRPTSISEISEANV